MRSNDDLAGAQEGMRRVARNTAFMLAGDAGVKLLAAVFGVVVVRRFGPEDFGRYAAALAFVGMWSILTDLGTSQFSLRALARGDRAAALLADLIGLRLLLSLAALLAIPALAEAMGEPNEQVVGVFVGSLVLLVHAVSGPVQALMIARERLAVVSAASVANQALFVVFGTVSLLAHGGFVGLLVAVIVSQALVGAGLVQAARRRLSLRLERPSPARWPRLLRSGLPFFVSQVSDVALRRFELVYILWALSATQVGWYSVAVNLVAMLMPLSQSLGFAIFPRLVRENAGAAPASEGGNVGSTLQNSARWVLLISLPIAAGGFLLADRIIETLYTAAFQPAVPVLRLLVWSLPLLFLQEVLGRAVVARQLEHAMARISLANAIVCPPLTVLAVTYFGIAGAAAVALSSRMLISVATVVLLGAGTVFGGSAAALLRTMGAVGLMAAAVAALERGAALAAAPPALALAALIGIGSVIYAVSVFLLQGISVGERRFLLALASDALRRRAWRS